MKVTVVLTCFNRKNKTTECIKRLVEGNREIEFSFVIVDDGSTDGTREAIEQLNLNDSIKIIETEGNCFYSGGMRIGMKEVLKRETKPEYLLIVNDDVKFYKETIQKIVKQSKSQGNAVIVGSTCDDSGKQSYGAVLYTKKHSVEYRVVKIGETVECDTFNANCVLIPYHLFERTGPIDDHYVHALGDFDFGLSLKRAGAKIYSSEVFVGECNRNSNKGTWGDLTLSRKERIIAKENVKGAPAKQWFYFLKKNFGLGKAIVFSVTPYVRILLGR